MTFADLFEDEVGDVAGDGVEVAGGGVTPHDGGAGELAIGR